jgi:iron-sulfur cluster repair protein YtfE (RIC family)
VKKTTVTESFDENGKIVKRVTVTEDDYTPYYPGCGSWNNWYWPKDSLIVSYNGT